MASPFEATTPNQYMALMADLVAFHDAYVNWLPTSGHGTVQHSEARDKVLALATKAERAINISGLQMGIGPPLTAPGHSPRMGLVATAFAHEDPVFNMAQPVMQPDGTFRRSGRPQSYDLVIDTVKRARAVLEHMRDEAADRRSQPTYWADRVLRAVLGFPAYLLSLVLGFDRHRLGPKRQQSLWVLSTVSSVATIVLFVVWLADVLA